MGVERIIEAIDNEIEQLNRAKSFLSGSQSTPRKQQKKKKSTMSPEARARISAATKARWAALRKQKKQS